ncbi:MAG TPA: hypothetical protein VKZ77_04950 [Bacillaceae bacterium]|nr:hypothetical protein [Bacillaceae bacterium]
MNIFQQLKSIVIELNQEEVTQQNAYGLEVLRKSYTYLQSGTYTNVKHKEIILNHLEFQPKDLSSITGISEQALTKAKYRIFKDFEKKLSPTFVSLLKKRNWKMADDLLFLANHSNLSQNYILPSFMTELERVSKSINIENIQRYTIDECSKELKLLRVYSFPMMSDYISELDSVGIRRLIYLLLLLNGKVEAPLDRQLLFRILAQGNHP